MPAFVQRQQIKFIKVAHRQMKQVNNRMLYITNTKTKKNQMICKKTALLYKKK